jgi:hypothetical protein
MNAELNISEEVSDSCVETATTKILLAYRDPDHERLGRKYCDLISEHHYLPSQPDISEWKFEMLACPGMDKMAAEEALHAGLVVIATSCGDDLPKPLKKWITSWCSQTRRANGTLVVLLSECPGYSEAHWSDYAFLETQAERCGMRLVVYATGLPPEDGSSFSLTEARRVTGEGLVFIEHHLENVVLV